MKRHLIRHALALAALTALAACNGNGTSVPQTGPNLGNNNGLVPQNFVGIGDSLTFGEQSDGELGAITTNPLSALSGNLVQTTQTNGFWALMWAQKNGVALDPTMGHWNVDTPLGATNSPLPLIGAPGLGAELTVTSGGVGFTATHSPCDNFNLNAYSASAWEATRVNAAAPIADLGVPGMTMHEAVAMTAPLTGPPSTPSCTYVSVPGDVTSGGLQALVNGESQNYYAVLGQFQRIVAKPTLLNDALYLKPQLATVWLGANDVLKYIFSHGNSPATDTPQQLATDLTQIVGSLQAAGSKVVVANLPDILGNPASGEAPVPQFFPQTKLSPDLQKLGVPAAAATAIASYVSANYTQGSGGFLTESGFFSVVGQFASTHTVTPNLDPNGPGSGAGSLYIDQTFAAQAIALNAAYNTAIAQVATGTNSALVDIQSAFKTLGSSGVPLGPTCTLTLEFGGGVLSYDGLHPSNTGYALIANAFIGAADAKFSMTIPPLSNAQIGAIAANDQNNPCVIASANPAWPYPLP